MDSIRALLLMGGQHDQPFYYAELAGILAGEGGVDLRITHDLSVLSPATLEQFDVVVNWSTFVDAESREVQALLESVRRGTGLVALHGGNATFWNSAEYLTMLGSRFMRHDPIKPFLVHIEHPSHPIVAGVSDFEIEDELFEIGGDTSKFEAFTEAFRQRGWSQDVVGMGEGPLPPDVTVLASADGHPLLYTRMAGAGRVHYNALGHDERALRNDSYRRLVLEGVKWAAATGRAG